MNIKHTTLAAAGVAAIAMLATGCRTVVGSPADGPLPGQEEATILQEDKAGVAVNIAVENGNPEAERFARLLKIKSDKEVVKAGFQISDKSQTDPDVVVKFKVSTTTFDKSGNYYVVDATVGEAVTTLAHHLNRIVAKKRFAPVRGDRILGFDQAVDNASVKAIDPAIEWLLDSLSPEKTGLGACTITFRRRALLGRGADPKYVNEFVKAVGEIEGVFSCMVIAGNDAIRTWKVRVVYDRAAFPGGLANTILGIKGLNLALAPGNIDL